MPRRFDRRRRVIVDRDLQLRLVGRMAAAFFGSLLLFLAVSLGAPVALGALMGVPDWGLDVLGFRLRFLAAFVLLPLLSGIFTLFAVGVRSTFGVAGPLYRFREVFRDLGRLRLPRGVRIRKDDVLQETARLLDESLVAVHEGVARLQRRARAASTELDTLVGGDPAREGELAALRDELRELVAEAERFELLPRAPYDPLPAAPASPVEPLPASGATR
jgi:hypothetical protein